MRNIIKLCAYHIAQVNKIAVNFSKVILKLTIQ